MNMWILGKHKQQKIRNSGLRIKSAAILTFFLLFLFIPQSVYATSVVTQSSWSGGVSSSVPTAASNSTNWTSYTSGSSTTIRSGSVGLFGVAAGQISTGNAHNCAVTTDGAVYCWGNGVNGHLGNGGLSSSSVPVRVLAGEAVAGDQSGGFLANIVSVSVGGVASGGSGAGHACAVSALGNAYCWGGGANGKLGIGSLADQTTPVRVQDGEAVGSADSDGTYLINVSSISAGLSHTCAVSNAGKAYCWGNNANGRTGIAITAGNSTTPVRVQDGEAVGSADSDGIYLINIASLSSSGFAQNCAVSNAAKIYCWGRGGSREMGDGGTTDRTTPVRPHAGEATAADTDGIYLANIASTSTGNTYSCAVSVGGNAYCWGSGGAALGNGGTAAQSTPVHVLAGEATVSSGDASGNFLSSVTSIAAGGSTPNTCATTSSFNAYCWGSNGAGQLGDGTTTQRTTPVRVHAGAAAGADADSGFLVNVAYISVGGSSNAGLSLYSCAANLSGKAYCWGGNANGQFGDGTITSSTTPVAVQGTVTTASLFSVSLSKISSGTSHSCAISTTGGNPYCWGSNTNGQLGDGTINGKLMPGRVLAGEATGADTDGTYLTNIAVISAGSLHTCAVSNAGKTYCWGSNTNGRTGITTTTGNSTTPVRVLAGEGTGADTDGTYLVNSSTISAGSVNGGHTCAVSAAGNAYCWGLNSSNQLGDGTGTQRTTPVRVHAGAAAAADTDGTNLINISSISAGDGFACAASVGGNAYCWGSNDTGQLGDSSTSTRSTPVRVLKGEATGSADSDGTNLINISSISAGGSLSNTKHTCAVSNAAKAYCWGGNVNGELGDSSTTQRTTPVRVQDGEAVGGADSDGTYLVNISVISAGSAHSCAVSIANKTYCWGNNLGGRTGINTITGNSTTPVRVLAGEGTGADTDGTYLVNSLRISAGDTQSCDVSNAGNAYCWGGNSTGQVGNGVITDTAVPARLVATTNIGAFASSILTTVRYSSSGTLTSSAFDTGGSRTSLSHITWTANTPAGTALTIDVRTSSDGSSWGGWTNFSSPGNFTAPFTNATGNQYFQYRVNLSTSTTSLTPTLNSISIFYDFGTGSSSSPSSLTCGQAPSSAPLIYSAVAQGGTSIKLSFTDAGKPADHYAIYYGTKSGQYQWGQDNIGPYGTREYTVSSLTPNTTYYFKVRAGNGCTAGAWSNEISATTLGLASFNQLLIQKSELVPENTTTPTSACTPYVVVSGDSLWSIAQKIYGKAEEKYKEIKEIIEGNKANYPSLEKSNDIRVGWKLQIGCSPKQESSDSKTYSIRIRVVDNKSKPIKGAKVTIHSKVQEAITDKDGFAHFVSLEAGSHEVSISYDKFQGKESISLAGEVKEIRLDITVSPQKIVFSPISLAVIGIMGIVVIILTTLLIRPKLRNRRSRRINDGEIID